MRSPYSPRQNHILAALPVERCESLFRHLELVAMPLGYSLYESDRQMQHIYFPTTAIVSLVHVMEDGASTAIAMVGNEGVVGVPLFMGGKTTPGWATVYSAGHAYRLLPQILIDEFNRVGGRRSGALQDVLLRYAQALMTQTSQIAVCNRHHSLQQQLCRWLLMSLDRLPANELIMTQELIATMLGVRREGVTEAARNLQQAGLIEYRRGHITVVDRVGLKAQVCECYAVIKTEFDRLLPEIPDVSAVAKPMDLNSIKRLHQQSRHQAASVCC